MKKLIIIIVFIVLSTPTLLTAQEQQKKSEYCILRVLGSGHLVKNTGAYIIYEDLKVEKTELIGYKPDEILKTVMEKIVYLKNKGYSIVSSTASSVTPEFYEYVFKKES